MQTVLIVDDDRTVLKLVTRALRELDVCVFTASNAREGLEQLRERSPDAILLDIMLPDDSGLEIAQEIREFDSRLPVIFITVSDDSDVAIEAMKLGAYEFLLKPLHVENVRSVVERALEVRRMMQVPVQMADSEHGEVALEENHDALVGRSSGMLEVYKEVGRVAAQNVSVLICGESGTGKELVARAIYHHSQRKNETFLAVNCAALSDTLLESELFGHEKGSFTGADYLRIGKFEQCKGGTIFLDEVGDMSPLTQSKVLRLLQEQKFERVGGTETIQTDVRIISATNRDLEQMIEEGGFRLDLFHRLNGYQIKLPPLRDRGEDLELLINHFLARLNAERATRIRGISPEALQILKEYAWPGNVRELQMVINKTVLKATGPILVPEFLPDSIVRSEVAENSATVGNLNSDLRHFIDVRESAGSNDLYAEGLEMFERYLLTRVLQELEGNQSKAAEKLGITRGSLRHKIRTLGISIDFVVQSGSPSSLSSEAANRD
ncbi:MAG TPA: sigma-54 dependent transcriptional regulator [Planctomycetaceae bacterium]|nr:sigma-54 dependent transcriptional regulator [Planctomycetaceae bacterium]